MLFSVFSPCSQGSTADHHQRAWGLHRSGHRGAPVSPRAAKEGPRGGELGGGGGSRQEAVPANFPRERVRKREAG